MAHPDGTQQQQYITLDSEDESAHGPDWSTDGTQVVFSAIYADGHDAGLYYGDSSGYGYWTTQTHTCAGDGTCYVNAEPVYSPDGTMVAFDNYDSALSSPRIYVVQTCDYAGAMLLVSGHDPAWQPVAST